MGDPQHVDRRPPARPDHSTSALEARIFSWGQVLAVVPMAFLMFGIVVIALSAGAAMASDTDMVIRVVGGVLALAVPLGFALYTAGHLALLVGGRRPSRSRWHRWWGRLGFWATAASLPMWLSWAVGFVYVFGSGDMAIESWWGVLLVTVWVGLAVGPPVGAVVLVRRGRTAVGAQAAEERRSESAAHRR